MTTTEKQILYELEKNIINGFIKKNSLLDKYSSKVNSSDFYFRALGSVYDIIIDKFSATGKADIISILEDITESGLNKSYKEQYLKIVGEVFRADSFISDGIFFNALNKFLNGAERREDFKKQKLIKKEIAKINTQLQKGNISIVEAQEMISELDYNEIGTELPFLTSKQTVEQIRAEIDIIKKNKAKGIDTSLRFGIPTLDKLTGGIAKQDLVTIAARAGAGKTHFVLQLIEKWSFRENRKGLLISLEMNPFENIQRIFQLLTGFKPAKFKNYELDENEEKEFFKFLDSFEKCNLIIDNNPRVTEKQIDEIARTQKRINQIEYVVIDYIGKINFSEKAFSPKDEITKITGRLKDLARKINTPIIALAQLNRESDKLNREPSLNNLADSSSIENDSNMVLLLWRPEYYNLKSFKNSRGEEKDYPPNYTMINLAKARNGETKKINCFSDPATYRIREASKQSEPEVPPQSPNTVGGVKYPNNYSRN